MSSQFAILRKIAKEFSESGEAWKPKHDEVMQKYKAADGLAEIVALSNYFIGRLDHLSGHARCEIVHKVTLSAAESLCALYLEWYEETGNILEKVDRSEKEGFPVDGAADLRSNHCRVGAMIDSIQCLAKRVADLKNGRAVSLKDAIDGIGTRVSPGRCG